MIEPAPSIGVVELSPSLRSSSLHNLLPTSRSESSNTEDHQVPLVSSSNTSTNFIQAFKTAYRDFKTCLKALWINRARALPHFAFLCLLAALVVTQVIPAIFSAGSPDTFCLPNGQFSITKDYNTWSIADMFQITMGFGNFSFAIAKFIDIVWDIVVGRGGQVLISILSYSVFTKALVRILEETDSTISYDTFRALVFGSPTLISTFKISQESRLRGGWRRGGWRICLSICWLLIASIYVIAFPTFVSAMTGYSPNVTPYYQYSSGDKRIARDQDFVQVFYSVEDTDRLRPLQLDQPLVLGITLTYSTRPQEYWPLTESNNLTIAFSNYIENYYVDNTRDRASVFTYNGESYNLSSPTLHITIFDVSEAYVSEGDEGEMDNSPMYMLANTTGIYNASQLNVNGSCDNQKTYQWGFSFLLLFIFCIITTVWLIGMYAMYNDSFWNSKLDRAGRQMGFYRGVMDMSNAMKLDMYRKPDGLCSEAEIKRSLKDNNNGGRIGLNDVDRRMLPMSRKRKFHDWRRTVPSLAGWTAPWKPHHWLWFVIFFILGTSGVFFAYALSPAFAILLLMICAGLKGLYQRRIRRS